MTGHKEARHSARMPQALTRRQADLLLEIGRYSPLARHACDIAQFLLGTGMTADGLVRLQWSDVDFEAEILRVISEEGDSRMVRLGYYEKELLLVWRATIFSPDGLVLGPNSPQVLDEAERHLRRAFEMYHVPGVTFAVIQSTSTKYGYARFAEPDPVAYIM